ncbi:PREDICTED: F-box/kelch-repeat [Prunus dulcis]|uniref:PREDICTED: F-box/kelch-repeat n=1 Tax=Prunus dulcis TaxID=3755 RepID=A0A5E4G3S3_PRUDU|nr:F-box/kelch-repeat protein SKIP25-like [Prunus dulcis]VVA34374.1 PREDICTED: F-box/kelch-repeat [Prunus dulcis]
MDQEAIPKPKHCRTRASSDETLLLPGLPNHLAQLCLAKINPSVLFSVCRSWRRLIYSPSFPPFFSLYAILSPPPPHHHHHNPNSPIQFSSLDPISNTWTSLPPPPSSPPLQLLHCHPSFLSRKLPIQWLSVSGRLVLVAATTHQFAPAMPRPLVFQPLSNQWSFGPPLPEPRRWCGVGTVGGKVYVASGIGTTYRGDVARSMEEWDTKRKEASSSWVKKACLKNGRFSREDVEAIGYRGKLWMVNSKGNAVKEGVVYDVQKDTWQVMPQGMLGGWNGPAAATINDDGHDDHDDDDVMYVVDERKGVLNKYVDENDCWEMVMESVVLREAEQVCAGRGRVCVVCANGRRIVVVDVVATPPRIWVVEPPPMLEVVAVHILPRMCRTD